mgnify:CR=1 FL=1
MDFFTKLGETLSDAGKDVSKKAKDITETTKLNLDIKSKEDYIRRQCTAIGRQYYELHKDDQEPLFEEIPLIREAEEEIARMQRELAELKGQKICLSCGAVMEKEAQFCPSCGVKYESIFEEEQNEESSEE